MILLTKVDEAFERSAALDEGADDYPGKRFDPPELVSRIRAILRRVTLGQRTLAVASKLVSGELEFDRTSRRVRLASDELTLTPRALLLLEYLMSHPDELFTRAIDHRVAELRKVLGDSAQHPRFIETVQQSGYRFVGEVRGS